MDSAPRFKLTHLFWIGLILLILGTGPLLAIVLAAELGLLGDPNPNPNPIGPGLLAFLRSGHASLGRTTAIHAALAANSLSFASARCAAGRAAMRAAYSTNSFRSGIILKIIPQRMLAPITTSAAVN
jgi:hypothetical protein